MDDLTATDTLTSDETVAAETSGADIADDAAIITDELLVEEISIDGMCGSTELGRRIGMGAGAAVTFDPSVGWKLHERVALRPEPFGAMAYHYGNRRLNFLRSHDLVAVVKDLPNHASVDDALAASAVASARWPSFRKALAALAASDFLVPAR